MKKMKISKSAAKPATAKKAAPAKEPASKPAAKPVLAKKPAPKKDAPRANASYHLSKREDGKWQLFIAGSDKVIKTFATKAEGEAYAKEKASNTGRAILAHNSKGASKGKIGKVGISSGRESSIRPDPYPVDTSGTGTGGKKK